MNFAMMMDGCAQHSYFVKDKKAYKLKSDNEKCKYSKFNI